KTVQVIALLLALKQDPEDSPSLIIAPASLLGNWRAELGRFAPSLRLFTAHLSGCSREDLTAVECRPEQALRGVDAVITTYQFVTSSNSFQQHPWNVLVLDEAQAIKNPGTAQTRAVKKLQARTRIALTGTPVENRPGDLWSLFDFLNPGLLGSASAFAETLKRLGEPHGAGFAPLRKLVQPYILRRMKTDRRIIKDLPDKTEVKARCPLTRKQATIYTRLVEELKRTLADETMEPAKRNGQVLGFLIKFKQVCNHPSHWSGDGQYRPEDSGKFLRIAEIGAELAERQERVIVFTQFAEICEPLAHHLAQVFHRPGLVLHGGTPVARRAALVEQFQAADGPPFFVISVKAGGTGLTLTAASHVIHFDRWWNPAVENQATDRAYRIGQKKNVLVHKFVVPGTIEERIDRLIEEKKSVADDLLGSESGAEKMLTQMNNDELLRFVSLDVTAVEG
ncbi:MAG: SNF2-related protein, partial [Verrucomicrobiaceae bacterium]|nr:SNF2-related protein [Verrucomicrobiaceae bacterium]